MDPQTQALFMAAAGAGGAADISFAGGANAAASGSPQTFSNVPIGAADATRHIVVAVWASAGVGGSATIGTVTVAGQACTAIVSATVNNHRLSLFITNAPVPAGTTANISVGYTNAGGLAVAAYRLVRAQSITPTGFGSTTTDAAAVAVDVDAGGVIVAAAFSIGAFGAGSSTWTGVTEDIDVAVPSLGGNSAVSSASGEFSADATINVSCDSTEALGGFMMVAAGFR